METVRKRPQTTNGRLLRKKHRGSWRQTSPEPHSGPIRRFYHFSFLSLVIIPKTHPLSSRKTSFINPRRNCGVQVGLSANGGLPKATQYKWLGL